MSVLKEENLADRLSLFESAIAHAELTWDDPHMVCITKCCDNFSIPPGEYKLEDLTSKSELDALQKFRTTLSEQISQISICISYEGKKINMQCNAIKKSKGINCIWIAIPEMDNSIKHLQNAAHDFRAPLSSIIGAVNLMHHSLQSDSELDTEELNTFLGMIKFSTNKALNLANEIMELAELESETYFLRKERVVMKEFVKRYLDTHRLLTMKKRISVEFESRTDALVMLNEAKMTRVLDNVVTNAVKFSEEGTKITFTLSEKQGDVSLSIKDEGIGMSKRILENLFVKFGEAKRSGLNGEPTHGLGMSIVLQIMRLHGGDVEVKSEEMKGTQIDLILQKG